VNAAPLRTIPAVSLAAVVGLTACASKPAPTLKPAPAPQIVKPADLVVLLADPDGSVGAADVTTPRGAATLDSLRASTRVAAGESPSAVTALTDDEVTALFGDALSALPPSPQRFTLYFRFESEELTAESKASISAILDAVKRHPAPEVLVVGHTDTTGAADRNLKLGLRRASTVRELLIASQIDQSAIEATSHGETDLLVETADEVFEPRNRRVDITVR
jgi:OOP family OmpA-OmpF porin